MPNELTPVNVFHIGKGNILVVFASIFEIEGGARQEDKIAIGVLSNRCRVARHKPIKYLSPARRDPSSNASHRFFFVPNIRFQFSLYALDTGFWPSPLL